MQDNEVLLMTMGNHTTHDLNIIWDTPLKLNLSTTIPFFTDFWAEAIDLRKGFFEH